MFIYFTIDGVSRKWYAMKVIDPSKSDNEELKLEIDMLSMINHP